MQHSFQIISGNGLLRRVLIEDIIKSSGGKIILFHNEFIRYEYDGNRNDIPNQLRKIGIYTTY